MIVVTRDAGTVQAEFEEAMRGSGPAPFSECMDMAAAIVAQYIHTGEAAAVEIPVDVLTLLGLALALYQSGLDLYARDDGQPSVPTEVHHIDLADTIAVLTDPDRAWELLELSPGHLAWPTGRIRGPWINHAAQLRAEGPTSRWEELRQQSLAAITASCNTYTTQLGHLLSLVPHWSTRGWYDRTGEGEGEGDR